METKEDTNAEHVAGTSEEENEEEKNALVASLSFVTANRLSQ